MIISYVTEDVKLIIAFGTGQKEGSRLPYWYILYIQFYAILHIYIMQKYGCMLTSKPDNIDKSQL